MSKATFHRLDTPIGDIIITALNDMPAGISLQAGWRWETGTRVAPGPEVRAVIDALRGYFDGKAVPPGIPEKLIAHMDATPFAKSVLSTAAAIPYGETLSYGEVARKAGIPGASRAVGGVMRGNPFPIIIPCHRVIMSDGRPGGFGGKEGMKIWLLGFEGAPLRF